MDCKQEYGQNGKILDMGAPNVATGIGARMIVMQNIGEVVALIVKATAGFHWPMR